MRFTLAALFIISIPAIAVVAHPLTMVKRAFNANLILDFGHRAGINPDSFSNCDGISNARGVPIRIPCGCLPDCGTFIQTLEKNIAAGVVLNNPHIHISFLTDSSPASALAQLNAASVTLANLNGPGHSYPLASTTFAAQRASLEALARHGPCGILPESDPTAS